MDNSCSIVPYLGCKHVYVWNARVIVGDKGYCGAELGNEDELPLPLTEVALKDGRKHCYRYRWSYHRQCDDQDADGDIEGDSLR